VVLELSFQFTREWDTRILRPAEDRPSGLLDRLPKGRREWRGID